MKHSHTKSIVLVFVLSTLAGAVLAHHSHVVHYDPERAMELTGVVAEFRMRNPHSVILLDVTDDEGVVKQWEVEAAPAIGLKRQGWTEDSLRAGDVVTITGWPHRRSSRALILAKGYVIADGTVLLPGGPTIPESSAADAATLGVSGRWQLDPSQLVLSESLNPEAGSGSPLPLSRAALEARESYDPATSPLATCEPINLPALLYLPYYFDIRIGDGEAILHHEMFDVIRTIPLESEPNPQESTGLFGRAVERREEAHPSAIPSMTTARGSGSITPSRTRCI